MNILQDRYGFGRSSTLAAWSIDGGPVECFTIEDGRRKVKVAGETCIPALTFKLGIRKHGGFHERYAKRFAGVHEGMIEILDVPDFSDVLVHCGNRPADSRGCVCTVSIPIVLPNGEFEGGQSERAYLKLYPRIVKAIKSEGVTLTIREREAA